MASRLALRLLAAVAVLPLGALAGTGRLGALGITEVDSLEKLPLDFYDETTVAGDGTYIVTWDRNEDNDKIAALDLEIGSAMRKRGLGKRDPNYQPTKLFQINNTQVSAIYGADHPTMLNIMDMTEVVSVEANSIFRTSEAVDQTNATPGLKRISNSLPGGATYTFDDSAGQDIFVYVVDTGVDIDHEQLTGRAEWGANLSGDGKNTDLNGHGTHCAGTVAGITFGVAKKANIIAVKVLNEDGSGSTATVVAGLNWVADNVVSTKNRAVVNLSLGGSKSGSVDAMVSTLASLGVVVVAAAGNEGTEATGSPAAAPGVITVGAIDASSDNQASFSNFGGAVDIFAPGVKVLSSTIGKDHKATKVLDGTSMACPHVAGLAAYLMSLEGLTTPETVLKRMEDLALNSGGAVKNSSPGTTNLIANNGGGRNKPSSKKAADKEGEVDGGGGGSCDKSGGKDSSSAIGGGDGNKAGGNGTVGQPVRSYPPGVYLIPSR